MPIYRLIRHVIYDPREKETREVWGIDRPPTSLPVVPSSRDTDKGDPLRKEDCSPLLVLSDGRKVTWDLMFEWMTEAEDAGYTILSGFKNLSPYTQIIIRGP